MTDAPSPHMDAPHHEEEFPHTGRDIEVLQPNAMDPSSQRIPMPAGATRADIIYTLNKKVNRNEFGLPIWIYRSDLLPPAAHLTQGDVDAAALGLFYTDGYPVFENGTSFWGQLPHEPYTPYTNFLSYLQQAEELGIRQLDLLSVALAEDQETLRALYHEFYWSDRARAYDLFQTAAERKKREFRIRKMENTHFDQAGALLERLLAKFKDPAWIEELNAKEAIEALETLVKIQRLSTGLTGQHASSNEGLHTQQGASGEFIIRQISKNLGVFQGQSDAFQTKLEDLLLDPEQGMVIQEAILRLNSNNAHFQEGGASF